MTRRQLVYAAKDRQRIGNVAEREIRVDRFQADLGLHVRMFEQRLDLRAENERPAGRDGVVERFFPDAIARYVNFAPLVVPDRERKHSAQVVRASWSILLVSMNDRFRVGIGFESVTAFFEFGSEFLKVVDLAVENDRYRTIFAGDRLGAAGQIDDGKPPHAERYAVLR